MPATPTETQGLAVHMDSGTGQAALDTMSPLAPSE